MRKLPLVQFEFNSLLAVRHETAGQFSIPRYNRDLHLIHTIRGAGRVQLNRRTLLPQPGTVIAIPAFTVATFEKELNQPWDMRNIHYTLSLPGRRSIASSRRLPEIFRPSGFAKMNSTLHRGQRLLSRSASEALPRANIANIPASPDSKPPYAVLWKTTASWPGTTGRATHVSAGCLEDAY